MTLRALSLRNFRNLGLQDLTFPPEGVALVGDNAQGKSNLLEAVYYLETFRSFRRAADDRLVAFGEEVFRLEAELDAADGDEHAGRISAAYQRGARRKKVTLDGREPERLSDAVGRIGAVVVTPADAELVAGAPAERRRFLDLVLSLNRPEYLTALQRYRQALAQRNAALKADPSGRTAEAWNEGLLRSGAGIILARREWVGAYARVFAEVYGWISDGEEARMDYRPSVDIEGRLDPEAVQDAFREAVEATASRERRFGSTLVGPHRDELHLTVKRDADPLDLREYGSGGQRRTAALALRMAEARTLRAARGRDPILLLDDVFAELDPGRAGRILEWMEKEEPGQVILTAPRDEDVRLRGDRLVRWRIRSGVVHA